jgi:hypothetical protein
MPYVKAWVGEEDGDVLEIVEALERGERSAWIRDAIREKAGREPRGAAAGPVDLSPVVSELNRIAEALEPLTSMPLVPTLTPEEAESFEESLGEDPQAALRLNRMF